MENRRVAHLQSVIRLRERDYVQHLGPPRAGSAENPHAISDRYEEIVLPEDGK